MDGGPGSLAHPAIPSPACLTHAYKTGASWGYACACMCVCTGVLRRWGGVSSPLGGWGARGRSSSAGWLLRVMMTGSSITLMLLHCIRSWRRLKISSAREHLNANIPEEREEEMRLL